MRKLVTIALMPLVIVGVIWVAMRHGLAELLETEQRP